MCTGVASQNISSACKHVVMCTAIFALCYHQGMQANKADSTLRTSQAVPHPSTIRALCRLTSEVERDPVHSTRYGRQRAS